MFRKLKIELILINLILTGLVLVTIFSGIYVMMKKSSDNSAYMRMEKIAENGNVPPPGPREDRFDSLRDIVVKTDKLGNAGEMHLNSNLSVDEAREISKKVFYIKSEKGSIDYNGFSLRYIKVPKSYGFIMVFSDKFFDNQVMKRLIIISIIVCTISLVLVFVISLFLANTSLKPIIDAWKKQQAFVADASHELRTPLAVISTNLEIVMEDNNESVGNQRKWLENISLETKRMTKLIEDLLFLARSDSKKLLKFAEFNLSRTAEKSIASFEAVAIKHGIILKKDIEPEVIFRGNEGRIKQLIVILFDNAVKHTKEGGCIQLKVHRDKNRTEITVSDTGEGISEEYIDKIFDRFYKIDKSRSKRGGNFGLGLSIAKSIVQEHNGNIDVSSVVGKGTTFKIVF